MKIAANLPRALILLACAAALPGPAFAGKTSRSLGIKICQAAIEKQRPAPEAAWVVQNETVLGDTQHQFTFRVRSTAGEVTAVICRVDREAQTATLSPKP